MEAPEKMYISYMEYGCFEDNGSIERIIEYIRTDAFIEKAYKWLSLNLKMLMNVLDVEYDTHDIDIKDFIDDFLKHMKG